MSKQDTKAAEELFGPGTSAPLQAKAARRSEQEIEQDLQGKLDKLRDRREKREALERSHLARRIQRAEGALRAIMHEVNDPTLFQAVSILGDLFQKEQRAVAKGERKM